jgi:metal-sulfur cluster biosynthetic enzyme
MTLTTPGCPMHESLSWGVKNALLSLEDVEDVEVNIVWDPPWSPDRMSDSARARVGVR